MELKNGLSSPPCYLLVHMPLGLNCVGRRMVSVSFKPLQVLTAENRLIIAVQFRILS